MTKPTICQIHGACIGGAMELALACDLRVIAADAVIGMPETRIGLIPDVGGSSRLPAVVGLGRAKELIMTGKLIGGDEAERIGLVNRVAPPDELDAATQTLVDELLACAPVAVGLAKRVMDASASRRWRRRSSSRSTMQERCAATDDFAEGAARVPREARAGVQRALTDDWFRGRCGRMAVSRGCWAVHGKGTARSARAPSAGADPAPRGAPRRSCGSWNQSSTP